MRLYAKFQKPKVNKEKPKNLQVIIEEHNEIHIYANSVKIISKDDNIDIISDNIDNYRKCNSANFNHNLSENVNNEEEENDLHLFGPSPSIQIMQNDNPLRNPVSNACNPTPKFFNPSDQDKKHFIFINDTDDPQKLKMAQLHTSNQVGTKKHINYFQRAKNTI